MTAALAFLAAAVLLPAGCGGQPGGVTTAVK